MEGWALMDDLGNMRMKAGREGRMLGRRLGCLELTHCRNGVCHGWESGISTERLELPVT